VPDFPAAALGDDESSDGPGVEFGGQRKTGAAVEVDLQLEARVGDSGSEALLVDFPQGVEIFGTEVAQAEALTGKSPLAKYWLHTGLLKPEDRVVLFNTGAGLKYTDVLAQAAGLQRPS